MTGPYSELSQASRDEARRIASEELSNLGFKKTDSGHWVGDLVDPARGSQVPIRLELPQDFPDSLPDIYVQNHPRCFLHVDRQNGKLCLPAPDSLIIDTERPAAIVRQTLSMASETIGRDPAQHQGDFAKEFCSYWSEGASISSICDPATTDGVVFLHRAGPNNLLIAPNREAAAQWLNNAGRSAPPSGTHAPAFVLQLSRPPDFDSVSAELQLEDLIALLRECTPSVGFRAFEDWLHRICLPAHIIMTAPVDDDGRRAVFAATVHQPDDQAAKRILQKFTRRKRQQALRLARKRGIVRSRVTRLDADYLTRRAGGNPTLLNRTVVVVGCGSVGSHTAVNLAASGVGDIRLIDPEEVGPENIHRHALGFPELGNNKAEALSTILRRRFPHLRVSAKPTKIEDVLDDPASPFPPNSLFVICLGNENIERRLNRFFERDFSRIHVWVEPLGLGGHVLSVGHSGCFECLFPRAEHDDSISNIASYCEPNQKFQVTLGGCAGAFSPYGVIDAQRAAVEATRAAIQVLLSNEKTHFLRSWLVATEDFEERGYRLSIRGQLAKDNPGVTTVDASRLDCPVCKK